MDTLRDTFKALSDETRLQIMVLMLENDELCVCDFVGALGQTQSKISRHLRYLYHSGLLKDRRAGLWMHYRLSPDLKPEQRLIVAAFSDAVPQDEKQKLREALAGWLDRRESTVGEEGDGTCCC